MEMIALFYNIYCYEFKIESKGKSLNIFNNK